jgi:hypothetical protein
MRDSQGPSISKVGAGISVERIEFSTLRMAERGMRKRTSCSAISWIATIARQLVVQDVVDACSGVE